MEDGLHELLGISDVVSLILYDNQGEILHQMGLDKFSESETAALGELILHILSSLGESGETYLEGDVSFARWRVFFRDLNQALLVLICNPAVDMSMVRLTLNVIVEDWRDDRRVQGYLSRHEVDRIAGENILEADIEGSEPDGKGENPA